MRFESISSDHQARFSRKLDPFVAYLAVNYLDRFVSRQGMPVNPQIYIYIKRRNFYNIFDLVSVRLTDLCVAECKTFDFESTFSFLPFSRCEDDENYSLSNRFPGKLELIPFSCFIY